MTNPPSDRPTPTGVTYHLSPRDVWERQAASPSYVPEAFPDEGFVHTTIGLETVLIPANHHYADDPRPYVCLAIDLDRVPGEVRFDADPLIYPHIYSPVPTDAITEVRDADRNDNGTFTGFGPPRPPA